MSKSLDRKIRRLRLGLRQIDAASAMGVSPSAICTLENEGYLPNRELEQIYDRFLSMKERGVR